MSKKTYEYKPPVLVSVDDLKPALYNPREADEYRLELLAASLGYLGFLLPLYATPEGHLLSGHQRLRTAKSLGVTHVPVCYVDIPKKKWKNLNILFNRVTNDMDTQDNSEIYENALDNFDLSKAIQQAQQKEANSPEFYPCLEPKMMRLSDLADMCKRQYSSTAVSHPKVALAHGIAMPILMAESGHIINGNYRIYAASEKYGADTYYPTVVVPDAEAHLAEALVNLISMKFTVEKQMADNLRWGGYRRPENKVQDLVTTMRYWPDGIRVLSSTKSLADPAKFWSNWRKWHGGTVVDLGAGQRRNGLILRQKGIDCLDWEPYPCDWQKVTGDPGDKPSLTLSRQVSNEFLDQLETGKKIDSVFMSAVINSVPFHKDRMCVLALAHALCSFKTGVFASARQASAKKKGYLPLNRIDDDGKVHTANQMVSFSVPYEENVNLTDISKAPKIQKFHTKEQLYMMFGTFWANVKVHGSPSAGYVFIEARQPRRINPMVLRKALELEFNLPYPNGESINLHHRALEVFSKRHNVDLFDPKYAPPDEESTQVDPAGDKAA